MKNRTISEILYVIYLLMYIRPVKEREKRKEKVEKKGGELYYPFRIRVARLDIKFLFWVTFRSLSRVSTILSSLLVSSRMITSSSLRSSLISASSGSSAVGSSATRSSSIMISVTSFSFLVLFLVGVVLLQPSSAETSVSHSLGLHVCVPSNIPNKSVPWAPLVDDIGAVYSLGTQTNGLSRPNVSPGRRPSLRDLHDLNPSVAFYDRGRLSREGC